MNKQRLSAVLLAAALAAASNGAALAQSSQPLLIGMGDSIGEGVQSADASWRTQPYGYLSWIAYRMGVPFELPLIESTAFGMAGEGTDRVRLNPFLEGDNLAVSGATLASLLRERPNATQPEEIFTEAERVLFPRTQSQMEIAEGAAPDWIICWIGNNDALAAVRIFDQLDGSQLTPLASFAADYRQLTDRLAAIRNAYGTRIVLTNLPDVTDIGFLLDSQDLQRLLGDHATLPEGHYTTLGALVLLRSGLADMSLLDDPDYVLDPQETAAISERIAIFNTIIEAEAERIEVPVVDVNGLFKGVIENPPSYSGFAPGRRYLRGLFSLDGIHPSNIGHALLANAFIDTLNRHYNAGVPPIDEATLNYLFLTDPSVDKDGDNRATGRPFAGFLETLFGIIGLSADDNDWQAIPQEPLALQQVIPSEEREQRRDQLEQTLERIYQP